MKKIFVIMIALMAWLVPSQAQTQKKEQFIPTNSQIQAVLLPMFGNSKHKLQNYPRDKQLLRYYFSYYSFYVTDEEPAEGIPVYDLSELHDYMTGGNCSNDLAVDPATFSFYRYDFGRLRAMHPGSQIAFRTPGSSHAYVILRTYGEADGLANATLHK